MGKNHCIRSVGMDVIKKSIAIALADDGPDKEARLYGTIKNTLEAIDNLIRKLVSTGAELHFVYEAGPCSFGLYRHLTGNGSRCIVAAPSMVPKKSRVRIKMLPVIQSLWLICSEQGNSAPFMCLIQKMKRCVISPGRAMMRELRHRNGFIHRGKEKWTKAHDNWLAKLKMNHPAQQVAFQEYIDAVNECTERMTRLDEQIFHAAEERRCN